MDEQISLWDALEILEPGDYVKTHGPPIPVDKLSDYIGKLVVSYVSTQSYYWYRVYRLEKVKWKDEALKLPTCILYDGKPQRGYITYYPWGGTGYEIYELRPCDEKNTGYIERR